MSKLKFIIFRFLEFNPYFVPKIIHKSFLRKSSPDISSKMVKVN